MLISKPCKDRENVKVACHEEKWRQNFYIKMGFLGDPKNPKDER